MDDDPELRVGVKLPSSIADTASYLADAVALEDAGVDSLWVGDAAEAAQGGDAAGLEPWTLLAALAAVTHRVRIGTAVSAVTGWPPALFARVSASLDRLSRGRLVVVAGTGSQPGWSDAEPLDADARGDRLEEFVIALRALWRGAPTEVGAGDDRASGPAVATVGLRADGPPVFLSATGPAGLRRAAPLAQGYIHPAGAGEAAAAAFATLRTELAGLGTSASFELWCQVGTPRGRKDWGATLAGARETGATGVIVTHSTRLLDLLRNPDSDDDRVDLLLAQG